jgi:hypothetical protein
MRTGNRFTPGNNEWRFASGSSLPQDGLALQTIYEDVHGVLGKLAGMMSGGGQASQRVRNLLGGDLADFGNGFSYKQFGQ